MSHWFDRISVRATSDEGLTRRDAIKAAAVGTAAAGTLASPAMAGAKSVLVEYRRRESACKCQDAADKRMDNNFDQLEKITDIDNPLSFITPISLVIYVAGGSGAILGWGAAKLACGTCDRSPSGGKKPAPPNFTPCTPLRGGLRRGPECPGGGGGGGGGSNTDCPPNTTRCTLSLCCYGSDVCCNCGGEATCCIAEVGCGCC